jgi:hypothetical protein
MQKWGRHDLNELLFIWEEIVYLYLDKISYSAKCD